MKKDEEYEILPPQTHLILPSKCIFSEKANISQNKNMREVTKLL